MTHYTMSYAGLTDEEKSARAIQDIKNYLGEDKFETVSKIMRNEMIPYEHVYGAGTAVQVDAEQMTGGN